MTAFSFCHRLRTGFLSLTKAAGIWLCMAAYPVSASVLTTLTPPDRTALDAAGKFINRMQQAEIKFNQTNPDRTIQQGLIALDRTRKLMRITYEDQDDMMILIKNNLLEQIMIKEQRVLDYPVSATPVRFLVDKAFSFHSEEIEVTHVRDVKGKTVSGDSLEIFEVTLREAGHSGQGLLLLYFIKETGFLVRWTVQQPSGESIIVDIISIKPREYRRNDPTFRYDALWYQERN